MLSAFQHHRENRSRTIGIAFSAQNRLREENRTEEVDDEWKENQLIVRPRGRPVANAQHTRAAQRPASPSVAL